MMIKIERTPTAPPSLETEKAKNGGSYRKADVIDQLEQDFNGKCYLCEIDQLQSVEVEHLKPHKGDAELKFDWNNLFYSCAHCNSVKNKADYDGMVLDCCAVDPEKLFEQKLQDGVVSVCPLCQDAKARVTAQLIVECFEQRNTGIRVVESKTRVEAHDESAVSNLGAVSKRRGFESGVCSSSNA